MSVIIRIYLDHMRFASYMAVSFITFFFIFFWFYFVSLCIWLYVLYGLILYKYLVYSLCYVCSVLGILFHYVVLCIVFV